MFTGVVVDVCSVLLYLYGVCLGVYIFTGVAFRDAVVCQWNVRWGGDKAGVLSLFLKVVVVEDLLLVFIFPFQVVFFEAFDIVINSVGGVLWEEGAMWLPLVVGGVLNSPLALV